MADAEGLLDVARLLSNTAPASNSQTCHAVSTVYYALFHMIIQAAARRFVGTISADTAAYTLLYRSFDHHHMRMMFDALDVGTLKARLKRNLGRTSISADMRRLAFTFAILQDARHYADYNPNASFQLSEVAELIDLAVIAIAAFDRVDPVEQSDVLALLMVKSRD